MPRYVLQSFAHHAPPNALIAIKNHPLDAGLVNHARAIRDAARELGLAERVRYYEDGDLWTLFKHSAGVVTVNSTAGLVALELGRPTLTLSDPIYNLPGLTHRGTFDAFWIDAVPPDAKLFCRFRRAVMHATQVNGGFYCRNGIPLAVENSVPFLEAERSPLEMLL
jgi:capsular polysaccharide export protein